MLNVHMLHRKRLSVHNELMVRVDDNAETLRISDCKPRKTSSLIGQKLNLNFYPNFLGSIVMVTVIDGLT